MITVLGVVYSGNIVYANPHDKIIIKYIAMGSDIDGHCFTKYFHLYKTKKKMTEREKI